MTPTQVAEIGLAALVAGSTAGIAVVQLDMNTVTTIMIPVGASAVVGYFSAQVTVNSQLTELRTEVRLLREEIHRYYRTKQGGSN